MMLKAVIFDIDDTLYDYIGANVVATEALIAYGAAKYGISKELFSEAIEKSKKIVKERIPTSASQHSRVLYCQCTLELLGINSVGDPAELEKVYWGTLLEKMQNMAGAKEIVAWLKEQNIKIGICTDMTAAVQHRKLVKIGIKEYVDAMVTSEEVGMEKPNACMFNLVVQKLGVKPEECLMVGDNWRKDIQGAKALGIGGIWYNPKESNTQVEDRIWRVSNYTDGYMQEICRQLV